MAKSLVGRLKFYGAQSAAKEIAKLLSTHALPEGCIVVPVPTATSRARQRGYDQAKRIARDFARHNNLPYLDCLARIGQSHQVGARRSQRIKQLRNAYRVKSGMRVKGIEIILIDDVLTTGATLEAAAACLKASGAKRICAQTFTQA
ncbi:MAG: phosphoribosyltransferase family protein [Candidatus Saccharimonadales bacterium]